MAIAWRNIGTYGTAGMIHYDTHFAGVREGHLRAATYRHLRLYAHFQNRRLIFSDIDWNKQFSVNIYGNAGKIDFTHISWLFDPATLIPSMSHDGVGEVPGLKYDGAWDLRPHRKRFMQVNEETLTQWRKLFPVDRVKLIYPVSSDEQQAISALARVRNRLADLLPEISSGYHEAGAKKEGLIWWETSDPREWSEVILRGPQINIATPIAKQPPNTTHTDKLG
jgi:hypothetical protein